MMSTALPQPCQQHLWQRRLEVIRGVECVVRTCLHCGRKELCWSRQPLSEEAVARAPAGALHPRGRAEG